MDAKTLLSSRDYGVEWRMRADAFLRSPTTDTRHAAEQALENYARQLRKATNSQFFQAIQIEAVTGAVLTVGSEIADSFMHAFVADMPIASVVAILTGGYLSTKYLVMQGASPAHKYLHEPRDTRSAQLPDPSPPSA